MRATRFWLCIEECSFALVFNSSMGCEVHLLRLVSMEKRVCREDFGTRAMFFVPREHTILEVDERKKNGQLSSMKARLHKCLSFPIYGSCFVCKLFGIRCYLKF